MRQNIRILTAHKGKKLNLALHSIPVFVALCPIGSQPAGNRRKPGGMSLPRLPSQLQKSATFDLDTKLDFLVTDVNNLRGKKAG